MSAKYCYLDYTRIKLFKNFYGFLFISKIIIANASKIIISKFYLIFMIFLRKNTRNVFFVPFIFKVTFKQR